MENIKYQIKNSKLIIEVDLSTETVLAAKLSSTGKTHLLASTHGIYQLGEIMGRSFSFSLNVLLGKAKQ